MAYNEINVNTPGIVLFNTESEKNQSMLKVDHWNDKVSMKLHPILPRDQWGEGKSKHDTKIEVRATLYPDDIINLVQGLFQFKEQFESNEPHSINIIVGSGTVIISNGLELGYENPTMLLIIVDELNEDATPKNYLFYEFADSKLCTGYNMKTGDLTRVNKNPMDNTQFIRFLTILKESVKSNNNSTAHSVYNSQKTLYSGMRELLKRNNVIAPKSSNNNYKQNALDQKSKNNSSSQPKGSIENYDEDDLNASIDDL